MSGLVRPATRRQFLQLAAGAAVAGPALFKAGSAWAQDANLLRMLCEDTDDVEVAWYKDTIAAFEKANPGDTIQLDTVNLATVMQKLTAQITAGDPPDMLRSTGSQRIATLADVDVLDSVDDVVDELGRDDFYPNALAQFVYNGKTLGVPEQSLATVCWYRTDMAKAAGVKPPTNWDELLAFAKATTHDNVYGVVFPVGVNNYVARLILTFFRQNGGDIVDKDLKVAIDSQPNRETLAFLKELYQYSPPGSGNYAPKDVLSNLTAGTTSMVFYEGRPLGRLAENAPDVLAKTSCVQMPYSKQPFNHGEPKGAIIFKGARNRDLAKKWMLEYQFAEPYYINWLLTAPSHLLPLRISVAQSPDYNNFPLMTSHKDIVETIRAASKIAGNFRYPGAGYTANPKGGTLDTSPVLPTMLQRYLLNGESADSVLAWAQGEVQSIMDS
jgi:multiple sugar transport system substrate-binding protein